MAEKAENDYCNDDKVCVYETILNTNYEKAKCADDIMNECEISIADNFKIKEEINVATDIKTECINEFMFCNRCHEYYRDYCTKCGMLIHILNKNIRISAYNRTIDEIPNDVLEVRKSFGHLGIFTLKVIPEGVRFGPFTGLGTSDSSWRIKGGRFVVAEENPEYLNWMQYINPAKSPFEQNLHVFQYEDSIYYLSSREIQGGEELLVYFGEEHEGSCNKDVEMEFIPYLGERTKEIFACTFCCLGFSSEVYLIQHKTICSNESNGQFSIEDLTQCTFCNIYLGEVEFLESHMAYCWERNVRRRPPLALDDKVVGGAEGRKRRGRQLHKCSQCKYRTAYKANPSLHLIQKTCGCGLSCTRFKAKELLKVHAEDAHINLEEGKERECSASELSEARLEGGDSKFRRDSQDDARQFECLDCEFRTKFMCSLKMHARKKHLRRKTHKCLLCAYEVGTKQYLGFHVKAKHLNEFDYECASCDFKTNKKSNLERHIKSKHLKEFNYECDMCDYKTNDKINLERHTKTNHLKEFDHKCEACEYKSNNSVDLEKHVKTMHLKEFDYECEACDYKTNWKRHLENHTSTKHLKEYKHNCTECDYRTNEKSHLSRHFKAKHLNKK